MSRRKIVTFIALYIGIILVMLFTYFYLQRRYARNFPRESSMNIVAVPRTA